MRFYEVVTPLRAHLAELSVKRGTMTEELDTHRTQMKALMEVLHTHTTTSINLCVSVTVECSCSKPYRVLVGTHNYIYSFYFLSLNCQEQTHLKTITPPDGVQSQVYS